LRMKSILRVLTVLVLFAGILFSTIPVIVASEKPDTDGLGQGDWNLTIYMHGITEFPHCQPYVNKESRILVPVRVILESMGIIVKWDDPNKTVILESKEKDKTIKFRVGEKVAYINDKEVTMDTGPEIVNGRTMVPLRFLAEALDGTVIYDQEEKSIVIQSKDFIDSFGHS